MFYGTILLNSRMDRCIQDRSFYLIACILARRNELYHNDQKKKKRINNSIASLATASVTRFEYGRYLTQDR